MEEKKELTEVEALSKEYAQQCAHLGEVYYQNSIYTAEIDSTILKIKEINQKAFTLKQQAQGAQNGDQNK